MAASPFYHEQNGIKLIKPCTKSPPTEHVCPFFLQNSRTFPFKGDPGTTRPDPKHPTSAPPSLPSLPSRRPRRHRMARGSDLLHDRRRGLQTRKAGWEGKVWRNRRHWPLWRAKSLDVRHVSFQIVQKWNMLLHSLDFMN